MTIVLKPIRSFIFFSLLVCAETLATTVTGNDMSRSTEWESRFYTLLDSSLAVGNSDLKKSLYFADQAKAYADSLDQEALFVKLFNQYGRIYFKVGLFEISSEYYIKSNEVLSYSKNIPTYDRMSTLLGLGINYLVIRNYDKAEEYFHASQKLLETLPETDYMSLSAITNNLGIIYRERGDLALAYTFLTNGIKTIEKLDPDNQNLTLLYDNLGRTYLLMKNYEAALEAFSLAEENAREKNNISGLVTSYYSIAETYREMKRLPQAILYARMAYEKAEQESLLPIQHNSSEFLADLYKELSMADSSLFFLEAKVSLLQKINQAKTEQNLLVADLEEIHELEKNRLIKESKSNYKKLFLLLFSVLLSLALLLYFYLTIRNKYKRISLEKMELKLESQNKELEKELLKAKIQEKNKELTAKLLYETKRIRIIKNTVDKLIGHKNEFSKQGRVIVGNVVRELSQFDQDKVFNEFESAFLDLHIDYYKNLMEAYPDLTQNERRLCALIRLNLNSREISALTGQTATTLNMAKTRLRKKLGITHSELDLYEVLCRF